MNYYVDSTTMKQIDKYTIEEIGIPSMVLMERAALKIVSNIKHNEDKKARILAVCGVGNNGGDGICAARILKEEGFRTEVFVFCNENKFSKETKAQFYIAKNTGINVKYLEDVNTISFDEYDIIIDAIFGIGLVRDVKDVYYDVIDKINQSSAKVYSVDVPSGINTDDGAVMNIAVKADYTVTFGVDKKGLILHPGRVYAGKVIVEDIGFPKSVIDKYCIPNSFKSFCLKEYKDYLPKRKKDSNKGDYGKVLVVAGSKNMAGACYFSAKSAYRMGAGLVQIFTCEDNREILQELVPEAIMTTYSKKDNVESILEQLDKSIEWSSVIVVGPGLGISNIAKELVKRVTQMDNKPKVIDADAINIMAGCNFDKISNVIFTPHMKEMSRLVDIDVSELKQGIYNINYIYKIFKEMYLKNDDYNIKSNDVQEKEINNILVLKDATTLITNGLETYVNTSGNNGLATGGSGDVLTGIIAGLLAQGANNMLASSLGVYLHGLCAEYYTERANQYALNATDLIESLQYIL